MFFTFDLKLFLVFQEALSSYCDATHKLIKSADTAGIKSKNEARELSKVFKKFVQGVNAHQKIVSCFEFSGNMFSFCFFQITEFDALAHKVHDYSNKDKEKLKTEFAEYKKEEKKMQKKKGGQTDKDIAAFHKKAAADWSKQQELRYKFFNDKIQSWIHGWGLAIQTFFDLVLSRYSELAKLYQPEQPPQIVVGDAVAAPTVEHAPVSENHDHAHWHEELHENAAAIEAEEAKKKAVEHAVGKKMKDLVRNLIWFRPTLSQFLMLTIADLIQLLQLPQHLRISHLLVAIQMTLLSLWLVATSGTLLR